MSFVPVVKKTGILILSGLDNGDIATAGAAATDALTLNFSMNYLLEARLTTASPPMEWPIMPVGRPLSILETTGCPD